MKKRPNRIVPLVAVMAVCVACQAAPTAPALSPAVPTTTPAVAPTSLPTQTAVPAPATATPFPTVPPTLPVGATPPLATQPASPSPATPFPALERREVVAQAVADLSGRLGVEPAAVEVVDVTTDEFPVQNLGCPSGPSKEEPVRPAFVLGEIIHLRVAGVVYEYRAHGRQVVFCGQQ